MKPKTQAGGDKLQDWKKTHVELSFVWKEAEESNRVSDEPEIRKIPRDNRYSLESALGQSEINGWNRKEFCTFQLVDECREAVAV